MAGFKTYKFKLTNKKTKKLRGIIIRVADYDMNKVTGWGYYEMPAENVFAKESIEFGQDGELKWVPGADAQSFELLGGDRRIWGTVSLRRSFFDIQAKKGTGIFIDPKTREEYEVDYIDEAQKSSFIILGATA